MYSLLRIYFDPDAYRIIYRDIYVWLSKLRRFLLLKTDKQIDKIITYMIESSESNISICIRFMTGWLRPGDATSENEIKSTVDLISAYLNKHVHDLVYKIHRCSEVNLQDVERWALIISESCIQYKLYPGYKPV